MVIERDKFGFDAPAALEHPARSGIPEGQDPGLSIGDAMPAIELPDSSGVLRNIDFERPGRSTAVVFIRSVVW
jgi:hypothetical protein